MKTNLNVKNPRFSLKQLIASNVLSILLMSLLTVSLVVAPAVINVYLDDLPSSATYTIKTDGTNFWAVRYDGYKAYESTNATYVIQNAMALGGSIFLKAGTYLARLIVPSNVFLYGEDSKTIISPPDASSTSNNATIRISGNNVSISHLLVNGLGTTQTLGVWKGSGIEIDGYNAARENIKIEYNIIRNTANHGIFVWGCNYEIRNVLIQYNEIYKTGNNSGVIVGTHGYGIWGARRFSMVRVLNNYIHDTYGGIAIGFGVEDNPTYMCDDVQIKSNRLINNKVYGIDVSGIQHFLVEDNYIDNTDESIVTDNTYGIFLEPVLKELNMSYIKNNFIKRQGQGGIYVREVTANLIIDGNTLMKNLATTGASHIILIASTADIIENITIVNNIISGEYDEASSYGILLYEVSGNIKNVIISNNQVHSTSYGIYISSEMENIQVSNNILNFNGRGLRITNAEDVIVIGNFMRSNTYEGVLEDGSADYNIYVANNMRDSTTNATLVGTHDVWAHNLP